MRSKNDVEVLINGRRYTICGFESAEYLQKVATYINGKYAEFKNQDYFYSLDMDLRNILLAINIADDYFKSEKENQSLVRDNERKDKMVLDMKHEVLAMQNKSDGVTSRKEELQDQLDEAEKKIVELNVKNEDNSYKAVSLEERLKDVEAENSSHATRLEVTQEQLKKTQEQLKKTETENGRLKKKNETLTEKVKTLEKKNKELTAKCEEETGQNYEGENAELKAKLEAAERRIKDLEARTRRGKR